MVLSAGMIGKLTLTSKYFHGNMHQDCCMIELKSSYTLSG